MVAHGYVRFTADVDRDAPFGAARMKNVSDAREWEQGWDGHARAQLHRLPRLALTEKPQWLEEADELLRRLSRGRAVSLKPEPEAGPCLTRPGTRRVSDHKYGKV